MRHRRCIFLIVAHHDHSSLVWGDAETFLLCFDGGVDEDEDEEVMVMMKMMKMVTMVTMVLPLFCCYCC